MPETVLTTVIYKYNPYARFIVVLYIVSMLVLCALVSEVIPMYIVWLALCFWAMPLVYGAISQKTVFNFRTIDNRRLTFTAAYIQVGHQKYSIRDIKIDLHINAYDGFIYHIRREGLLKPQITYGDNNALVIYCNGVVYDFDFHLPDYDGYTILCTLVDQWRAAGAQLTVKETFTREFVNKQQARINRRPSTFI
ncbi:hypothetical protein [Longitalea luteola]|uniref:hypothetical protein n=1 Tax=Longitalea luteola TaxID=2812563 RepID=UPI001A972C8C|nr:hypothetical protein [Longitalea luteola]